MTTSSKPTTTSRSTRSSATGASKLTEAAFQKQVVELAERCGWRVAHISDSRKIVRRGDRSIAVPDPACAGLPDLLLVHVGRRRMIFAELKRAGGRLRPGQVPWLNDLAAVGAEVFLWKPEHWPEIERVLMGRSA